MNEMSEGFKTLTTPRLSQEIEIVVDLKVLKKIIQFVEKKFWCPEFLWSIANMTGLAIPELIVEDYRDTANLHFCKLDALHSLCFEE